VLIGGFGAFVVWNKGVVVGDRSNHSPVRADRRRACAQWSSDSNGVPRACGTGAQPSNRWPIACVRPSQHSPSHPQHTLQAPLVRYVSYWDRKCVRVCALERACVRACVRTRSTLAAGHSLGAACVREYSEYTMCEYSEYPRCRSLTGRSLRA
jgi:hypothetical protein